MVLTITAQEWLEAPAYFLAFDNWIVKITVLAVLIAVGYYMFDFTRIGKDMKAIGGNANVAELSGVRVTRQKTLAYVIMGIFTAFAAFFSLARVGVASSTSGNGLDMDVLIALLLGGLPLTGGAGSRMSCAVVGAFSLAVLGNGLLLCGVTPNAVDGVKGRCAYLYGICHNAKESGTGRRLRLRICAKIELEVSKMKRLLTMLLLAAMLLMPLTGASAEEAPETGARRFRLLGIFGFAQHAVRPLSGLSGREHEP